MKFDRTQDGWDDVAREQFHKNHVEPLEPGLRSALNAMDKMAEMLARARNECNG